MIECEFSVLARLCLNRRIATIEKLGSETLALLAERSAKAIKINWQFSIPAARFKLNSHYTKVHPENEQYKETEFTKYYLRFCKFAGHSDVRYDSLMRLTGQSRGGMYACDRCHSQRR